jgi:hypothetical protein
VYGEGKEAFWKIGNIVTLLQERIVKVVGGFCHAELGMPD